MEIVQGALRGRRVAALPGKENIHAPEESNGAPSTDQFREKSNNTAKTSYYHDAGRSGQVDSKHFSVSFFWAIGVVGIVLRFLKYPIAILISLRLALFGLQYVAGEVLSTVCVTPGVAYFDFYFCQSPLPPPDLNAIVVKGLGYTSTFDEIQRLSVEANEIPDQLRQEEGNIRDLIIELSAIDESTRSKYRPLLNMYTDSIDANIASQIGLKATLDSTIDTAFTITSWAAGKMELIKKQESSPLLIAAKVMKQATGLSLGPTSSVEEVEEIFFNVANKFLPYIDTALSDSDKALKLLSGFQNLLIELALNADLDGNDVNEEKLRHASFWKRIFHSHREKMRNFDNKMELCARLYVRTKAAQRVLGDTKNKVMEVRAGFSVFRNDIKDASMGTIRGAKVPFDLLIEALQVSSEGLARTRDRVHQLGMENRRTIHSQAFN